jgi:DNA-binding CsgD family transcriptional regulator
MSERSRDARAWTAFPEGPPRRALLLVPGRESRTTPGPEHPAAPALPTSTGRTCGQHPESLVSRRRRDGPNGVGVYRVCTPRIGVTPHPIAWLGPALVPSPYGDGRCLSLSELDVLEDAANGLNVAETAASRRKSTETVKTQRRSIVAKLGARNVTHAVAVMVDLRLIDVEA